MSRRHKEKLSRLNDTAFKLCVERMREQAQISLKSSSRRFSSEYMGIGAGVTEPMPAPAAEPPRRKQEAQMCIGGVWQSAGIHSGQLA